MIKINIDQCIKCGKCVKSCVTEAIDPDIGKVKSHRCIKCSHCLAICPQDAITQDNMQGEYISPNNIKTEDFENLIYTRKSIRNYTNKDIDDKTLNKFINLMKYSPTGTNSQKAFVTVINSRERVNDFSGKMISFLKKFVRLGLSPALYPFIVLFLGKKKTDKFYSYKKIILNTKAGKDILCYNCPMLVLFHSSSDASTPEMDCNIQSSYASLHALTLGLGTCFNGFIAKGLNINKKLKRELGIPDKNKIYSSLLVGYPALNYTKKVIREDLKVNILS